jgi:type II secretory pathway pseudopilin PulG
LLLVLVVMGVMAGIAVPRYANSLARQRVGAASKRVVADLTLARHRAKLTGATQSVLFTVTTDLYTLVGMPDPDHAGKEYSVALSREPYRSSVVAADFGGDAEVIFDVYAKPDSGGNVSLCAGDFCKIVAVDAETGIARVLSQSPEDLDPVPAEIKEQLPILID